MYVFKNDNAGSTLDQSAFVCLMASVFSRGVWIWKSRNRSWSQRFVSADPPVYN